MQGAISDNGSVPPSYKDTGENFRLLHDPAQNYANVAANPHGSAAFILTTIIQRARSVDGCVSIATLP